ncbi:MAG: hypothetical protein AB7N80_05850 [Bdellovibrionales bacterium]
MKVFFYLALSLFSLSAGATSLSFRKEGQDFQLEKNSHEISLSQRSGSFEIKLVACNKKLVNEFWQQIEDNFAGLPKINGRPSGELAYVKIDKSTGWLAPFKSDTISFFEHLPKKFLVLSNRAARACR